MDIPIKGEEEGLIIPSIPSITSLVPRPFVGETAWQLTQFQIAYGYDVKKITAAPVQPIILDNACDI